MNQVYRVVFNRSLGVWQCVAETAKARGKSSSKLGKSSAISLLSLMNIGTLLPAHALDTYYQTGSTVLNEPVYNANGDRVTNTGTSLTAKHIIVNDPTFAKSFDIENNGQVVADSLAISNGGKTYTSQGGKLSVEKLIISNGSYDSSSEFAVIRDGALQTKSTIVGDTGNANGLHVFSSYSTDSLLLGPSLIHI